MQGHATHKLNVERTLPKDAPCTLSDNGICLDKEVVKRLTLVEALTKLRGFGAQFFVRQRLHRGLKGIDQRDDFLKTTDLLAFTGAQNF